MNPEFMARFLTLGNILFWPASKLCMLSTGIRKTLFVIFIIHIIAIGICWLEWIHLVKTNNPDRLHFLYVPYGIGIVFISISATIFITGVVNKVSGMNKHTRIT
jgi:hypothetical protein